MCYLPKITCWLGGDPSKTINKSLENLCKIYVRNRGAKSMAQGEKGPPTFDPKPSKCSKEQGAIMWWNPAYSQFGRSCAAANVFGGSFATVLAPLVRFCVHVGRFGHSCGVLLLYFGTLFIRLSASFGTLPRSISKKM